MILVSGTVSANNEEIREFNSSLPSFKNEFEQGSREAEDAAVKFSEFIQDEFQKATDHRERCERRLERAKSALQAAQAAEAACHAAQVVAAASGGWIDCSLCEMAVRAAEAEVTAAEIELARAVAHHLNVTSAKVRAATAVMGFRQNVQGITRKCLSTVDALAPRLETLASEIENYLQSSLRSGSSMEIQAGDVQKMECWISWQPPSGTGIDPGDIHRRFDLSNGQFAAFSEYISTHDQKFASRLEILQGLYSEAGGSAEKNALLLRAKKELSGLWAETFVRYALGPYGKDIQVQRKTGVDGAGFSVTDIVVNDLRENVILHRGTGGFAPLGGSIAVEVKTGKWQYLYHELDHLKHQAAGLEGESASLVIMSRDIKDVPPEKQRLLREILKGAGSPILGVLPRKEQIDALCWDLVTRRK